VTVEVDADPDALRDSLEELSSVERVHEAGETDSRPRFLVTGCEGADPRPEIFALARDRSWTLWEMRKEQESLEQFFRELTESP
jgi:hypothetical protein